MNFLQRLAVRLVLWAVPPLKNLLRSSGGSFERLAFEVSRLREREDARRVYKQRVSDDIAEALSMYGTGPWRGSGVKRELATQESEKDVRPIAMLKERLAELELALEDRGWKREMSMGDMEFSRWGIQQLILICRLYFIKNPLIRRGVQVSSHYVFGRGFEISSEEEAANEVIKDFLNDPSNAREISQTGLVSKEESLHTDGNLFWSLYTDVETGQVQVRAIDPLQIEEIITDPEDDTKPMYYHRRWLKRTFNEATGAVGFEPADEWYVDVDCKTVPSKIGSASIRKQPNGEPVRILHEKVGGLPSWHFGCPMAYSAIDWARAYRFFLEDWATITRALANFSWDIETKGGAPAIAGLKATLATTLATSGLDPESNPPATTGSAFVRGPGTKVSPFKTSGATTEPEQGRRVMLMVAAAFGLPETFFGDATAGSLATAKSLDRPTELKFLEAQERWRQLLKRLIRYVIEMSASQPKGRLFEVLKEAAKRMTVAAAVSVKFPSVLEHDISEQVTAIVDAMTLKGFPVMGIDEKTGVGLLLAELGVEDVQVVLDAMYPDYESNRALNAPEPVTDPVQQKEATLQRAIKEVKIAARKLIAAKSATA